jgi:hypothetical protein
VFGSKGFPAWGDPFAIATLLEVWLNHIFREADTCVMILFQFLAFIKAKRGHPRSEEKKRKGAAYVDWQTLRFTCGIIYRTFQTLPIALVLWDSAKQFAQDGKRRGYICAIFYLYFLCPCWVSFGTGFS